MLTDAKLFFNGMSGGLNGQSLIRRLKAIHIDPDDIAVCHCHTAGFACFATAIKHLNPHVKTVLQYHDLDPFQIRCGKFATWRPNVTYRVKKFTSQFKNIDLHLCISEHTRYNLLNFPTPHPDECYAPYLTALHSAKHLMVPRNINTYVLLQRSRHHGLSQTPHTDRSFSFQNRMYCQFQ